MYEKRLNKSVNYYRLQGSLNVRKETKQIRKVISEVSYYVIIISPRMCGVGDV